LKNYPMKNLTLCILLFGLAQIAIAQPVVDTIKVAFTPAPPFVIEE